MSNNGMNCEYQSNSVYRHFRVDNFARQISTHDPNAQKLYPDFCHCGALTLTITYTLTLTLTLKFERFCEALSLRILSTILKNANLHYTFLVGP